VVESRREVPSGTPLLFLDRMNDMPSQICFDKLLQYVDDTALSVDYSEVLKQLSEDL